MERRKTRKEIQYDGVSVVFDNPLSHVDMKRAFIINCILLYASFSDRTIRIIFFNGDDREKGVSFFFSRDNKDHEPNKLYSK